MTDRPIPEEIRRRAERRLRFRAKFLKGIFGFMDLIVLLMVLFSWLTWYNTTPGIGPWLNDFFAMFGQQSAGHILDQLLTIPYGFPWPVLVMIFARIPFDIVKALLKVALNYVNFTKVDSVQRRYDRAMRRETNGIMVREGLAPNWLDQLLELLYASTSSADSTARRKLDKFRRWVQMYNQIPEEEPYEKAKVKAKRDQTVRLSDDGELVFDDEPDLVERASNQRR